MERTPEGRAGLVVTGSAYALLAVLGVAEGVIGCFQFSRGVGTIPLGAWLACLIVFVTCLLGGLGMGSVLGALIPALAWFASSFVLTLPTPGGSVIVTGTAAGEWYLYGGAACAAAAVIAVYVVRLRAVTGGMTRGGRRTGAGS